MMRQPRLIFTVTSHNFKLLANEELRMMLPDSVRSCVQLPVGHWNHHQHTTLLAQACMQEQRAEGQESPEELALSIVESLRLGTSPLEKTGDGADDSGVGADVQLQAEGGGGY